MRRWRRGPQQTAAKEMTDWSNSPLANGKGKWGGGSFFFSLLEWEESTVLWPLINVSFCTFYFFYLFDFNVCLVSSFFLSPFNEYRYSIVLFIWSHDVGAGGLAAAKPTLLITAGVNDGTGRRVETARVKRARALPYLLAIHSSIRPSIIILTGTTNSNKKDARTYEPRNTLARAAVWFIYFYLTGATKHKTRKNKFK